MTNWPECDFRSIGTRRYCRVNGEREPITLADCASCEVCIFTEPGALSRPQVFPEIPPSEPEREWLHSLGIPCRG